MKSSFTILITLFVNFSFGQNLSTIFMEQDSATIFNNQFDFAPIAKEVSIEKKVDFFIDEVVLSDTTSIYHFTGMHSAKKLNKVRKKKAKIFSKLDTAAINKNLHFLDLNNDNNLDCIYDRLDPHSDIQFIEIFLSVRKDSIKSIEVPGFIVTDFQKKDIGKFQTYAWPCCDQVLRKFRKIKLQSDSLKITRQYFMHHYTPKTIKKPIKIKQKDSFHNKKRLKVYFRPNQEWPISYLDQNIFFQKESKLIPITSLPASDWKMVIGPFFHKEITGKENFMIGWIKQ